MASRQRHDGGTAPGADRQASEQRYARRTAPSRQCGGGPKSADASLCQRQVSLPPGAISQCMIRMGRRRGLCRGRAKLPTRSNVPRGRQGAACARRTSTVRKAAMGPLLRFKRLLEPGRARTLAAAHWRGGHCGHKHDPGDGPIRQSDHSRRQASTMALRGLAGRSRVHVIPCWLHGPAFAGASWACQRRGSRRLAGKLAISSPPG
jgi:hypothetical protein